MEGLGSVLEYEEGLEVDVDKDVLDEFWDGEDSVCCWRHLHNAGNDSKYHGQIRL